MKEYISITSVNEPDLKINVAIGVGVTGLIFTVLILIFLRKKKESVC